MRLNPFWKTQISILGGGGYELNLDLHKSGN